MSCQFMSCTTHSLLTQKDTTSNTQNRCYSFGDQKLCEAELCVLSLIRKYFKGCCSLTLFLSPCVSASPSVLCGLFVSISKLSLKSIYYLISLIYTSSSIPRSVGCLNQSQCAASSRQTRSLFNTLEDTEDCVVVCGNISL